MSEVEVYSVNKLKFWAMDKNVVGKKLSRPARTAAGAEIAMFDSRYCYIILYNDIDEVYVMNFFLPCIS